MTDSVPEEDRMPTVTCTRCDETWRLAYELDDLQVGNRAVERFAIDHHRHTGHFPDGVTPWLAECRQCPDGEQFLSEQPARRWAQTHVRHTRHDVSLRHAPSDTDEEIRPDAVD
ncbi:MAG: hypothetical protein V5A55_09530 [Halovenus sp.]